MSDEGKRKIVFKNVVLTHTAETIPPPPPGFPLPFKTLEEWLLDICDSNQPKAPVSEYNIGLYESPGNSLLCFIGYNHSMEQGSTISRITFQPSHTFFALPEDEYGNLSKEQLRERLLNEFIEFTKTDKFKNSFLSKANSITTDFGEVWSR